MAVGDIVTGKLDRSVTAVGSWIDSYQPASGVEVIIFNIILEVDFPLTSGTGALAPTETVQARAILYDGTDDVFLDTFSVTGTVTQGARQHSYISSLGTPMKLPLTNSMYLQLRSSLAGGAATGNVRLWYSGIQTK